MEIALQWCSDSFSDMLIGFANNIKTIDGGTHLDGLKSALTRTVNSLARKNKLLKEGDSNLSGDFVREGLGGVVSVKVPNPEFEGQTKTRLGNPEIRKIMEGIVVQVGSACLEALPALWLDAWPSCCSCCGCGLHGCTSRFKWQCLTWVERLTCVPCQQQRQVTVGISNCEEHPAISGAALIVGHVLAYQAYIHVLHVFADNPLAPYCSLKASGRAFEF